MRSGVAANGSFEVRLAPQPSSVAEARARTRDLLEAAGRDDLADSATLLVSEIVTNALLHAGTDMDVNATLDRHGLRVEVRDGSPHLPSRRTYGATAGTGRGLLMLESMVDEWGVTPHADGKTVWFRLAGPGDDAGTGPAGHGPEVGQVPRPRRNTVAVELKNMPLLLHAAWQEHAEALLREYLLASLDSNGDDPIRVHADATDAIAVLEEHVPRAEVPMAPDRLMGEATEPLVSADSVQVPVPLESVRHFETLDRAIEAALDLSDEGLALTPPTQPEVQAFRRWLCREVISQASGGAPQPWQVPDVPVQGMALPPDWDPAEVTGADRGVIAADATSRILAVSGEAARILGYDDPADLVGHRILSIVPERYRQAHVAGFTMYLLVGRKPLLDHTVVVPALRRDGVEVPVELTVHAQAAGNGNLVVVADIGPVEP